MIAFSTDARIPVPPNSRISILRLLTLHFVADPIYTLYLKAYCMYSLKEAKNAAQDWIDELGTMDWPADWALPNWRHVTIAAADCLALRIIDRSPGR
jgi:hypothetical protein